jgi:hypothetical protein
VRFPFEPAFFILKKIIGEKKENKENYSQPRSRNQGVKQSDL